MRPDRGARHIRAAALLAVFPALAAAPRTGQRVALLRLLLAWPGAWVSVRVAARHHLDRPSLDRQRVRAHRWDPGRYAPVVGVYGLCLIAAVIAGAAATVLQRGPMRTLATRIAALGVGPAAVAAPSCCAGEWTHPVGQPLHVKLIQATSRRT